MSFGAIIAARSGDRYYPVEAELEEALTEIRVEQSLDEATMFALRFQEDFEGDAPTLTEHPLFTNSNELVILVPEGPESKDLVCLVRGVIEQVSFDVDMAGTGSSFEARGRDVRMLLDRVSGPGSFTGLTSDQIIERLIGGIDELGTCLAFGAERYGTDSGGPAAFNSTGTALEVIESLAIRENHSVWLTYTVDRSGRGLTVATTLNVRSSPARPGEVLNGCPQPPAGSNRTRPDIKVLLSASERPNIINFNVSSDNERINEVRASAIDEAGGGSTTIRAENADPKVNTNGREVGEHAPAAGVPGATGKGPERAAQCTGPGGPTAVAKRSEAMATEASWYVEAETLTTATLYQGVLEPHQKIKVTGVGCEWTGVYQVQEVTHVINAAEHYMTAILRTNSRGESKSP